MADPPRNDVITTVNKSYRTDRYGTYVDSTYDTFRTDTASLTLRNTALMRARRRGEAVFLPPLYYKREVEKDEVPFGFVVGIDNYDPRYNYKLFGAIDPGSPSRPVSSSDYIEQWNNAERKALTKLKNQNVNFAQFFVEANQAKSLLANTASKLVDGVKAVKKGNIPAALKALGFKGGGRALRRAAASVSRDGKRIAGNLSPNVVGPQASQAAKAVAGNWLAMSFGWMPLLSDLDGTAQLLAERSTQDPKRTRFNVIAVSRVKLNTQLVSYEPGGVRRIYTYKGFYGVKVRLDFYFSNAVLASLSADGLTNPLALAWEELPFSFLADYVVGIGTWLDNLDSSLGKEFVGGSATLFGRWNSEVRVRVDYLSEYDTIFGNYSRNLNSSYTERHPYGDFPDATLVSLAIKNPLKSRTRTANTLAVLAQVTASVK